MTRALGCDISSWEGNVDFHKMVANGASFVYIKASQLSADPEFAISWHNAKGVLLRGAYHYLDFGQDELVQAKLFCNLLATDKGELPPCLDFEDDPQGIEYSSLTKAIRVQKAYNFLQYVEKTLGVIPAIYSGFFYWGSYGNTASVFARYPLWEPWYASESIVKTPAPWIHWTFWQYTSHADGKAFGCQSLGVDTNWFNGTVAELNAWANHAPAPVPAPIPAPVPPPAPVPSPAPVGTKFTWGTANGAPVQAVNVRGGPSANFPIVKILYKTTTPYVYLIIPPDPKTGYAQLADKSGWIFLNYFLRA
jgi:lysozyme